MPPKPSLCKVCEAAAARYKCAGCALPYCGVPCYRAHCPGCEHGGKRPAPAPAPAPAAAAAERAEDLAEDDELRARLPAERLERLLADPRVAAAMGDARLRRILAAIDAAPDRVSALEACKRAEGAPFRAFLDDVLVALGVAQRIATDGGSGIEFLGLP